MSPPSRARTGPVAARCRDAASRVRPRTSMAAHLASLGLEDLRTLAGLRLQELALLAEAVRAEARIDGRRMLELVRAEGVLDVLRGRAAWIGPEFLAAAEAALGWRSEAPEARAAALGVLEHLAEVQVLARHGQGYQWRGPEQARDLALPPEEEVLARDLFGGTLAFDRACLDALPEVLRGKDPPLGTGRADAALWEGLRGSPEQLVLRRIALKAVPGAPHDALDLACGPGFGTACLAEQWPGCAVTAIDVTDGWYPLVEERARASSSALGAPLDLTLAKPWAGWGDPLPFPDASFDLVVRAWDDGFVPPHRRRDAFGEVRRVLRPGGWLAMVASPRPSEGLRPRGWELRAQAHLRHAAGFAVAGFHGLATAEEHEAAAAEAGFEAGAPWRVAGLVVLLRTRGA